MLMIDIYVLADDRNEKSFVRLGLQCTEISKSLINECTEISKSFLGV